MSTVPLVRSELPLPLVARGKVRDVYDAGEGRLLLLATDRISAFDVVMAQPIPSKGEVLTQISVWWFEKLADITANHLIAADTEEIAELVPALAAHRPVWERRSMLVRRTHPIPVECVVRGYIAGSAWAEYRANGTLAGEGLPAGLKEAARLDPPIFSPATKAGQGHDENIPFSAVEEQVGRDVAYELRRRSLAIYERGREIAGRSGIIVADTKFEFGTLDDGTLLLIDEVLTPDSSRFWPEESYVAGRAQPSLDKQPVRDFLEELHVRGKWSKAPPAPPLPPSVVEATSQRYRDVFRRLTGVELESYRPRRLAGSSAGGSS